MQFFRAYDKVVYKLLCVELLQISPSIYVRGIYIPGFKSSLTIFTKYAAYFYLNISPRYTRARARHASNE